MTKSPFEVPSEMRDLAARSVEQARKAFETFIGAAQKASDAVGGGPLPMQKNMADASRLTVSFAERNVNAAFDMAQRLVQAKTVEEVLKIQSEYMQAQAKALQGQMQEAGDKARSTFEEAKSSVTDAASKLTEMAKSAAPKAPKKPAK
ncbi:MAG: phasin family protein [Proteobacteria bacterium]|nr:phasin family protein [Pseudomonadota bacterium]